MNGRQQEQTARCDGAKLDSTIKLNLTSASNDGRTIHRLTITGDVQVNLKRCVVARVAGLAIDIAAGS